MGLTPLLFSAVEIMWFISQRQREGKHEKEK